MTDAEGKTERTPKKRRAFHEWRPIFIQSLREYGVVSYAARCAGIGRTAVYQAKERNARFAAEWEDALREATDKLELEARRRAAEGVKRVKFYQGQPVMVPLIGEDGLPLFEDVLNAAGEPVLSSDGRPRRQPVMVPYVEHEYSDTLLIFLLKNWDKEKYGDAVRVSAPDGPLVTQTTINFSKLSDDELYDTLTAAMAAIAAPAAGDPGQPGS